MTQTDRICQRRRRVDQSELSSLRSLDWTHRWSQSEQWHYSNGMAARSGSGPVCALAWKSRRVTHRDASPTPGVARLEGHGFSRPRRQVATVSLSSHSRCAAVTVGLSRAPTVRVGQAAPLTRCRLGSSGHGRRVPQTISQAYPRHLCAHRLGVCAFELARPPLPLGCRPRHAMCGFVHAVEPVPPNALRPRAEHSSLRSRPPAGSAGSGTGADGWRQCACSADRRVYT